jgi:glycosyltransferase involved in cell wall biosynthesis
MNEKIGYLPQNERKKILLLTDDLRVHSGCAHIAREMVINTCHRYNWVQMAGAIKHPETGKRLDLSQDTNNKVGINDSSVILYPVDGYGNPNVLRQIINLEKPDAIFLITDPRYFTWLFEMENEIRKQIPIVYLSIWDDVPSPSYNTEFYESCDALFGISKQTHNIHKMVLDSAGISYVDLDTNESNIQNKRSSPIVLKYVPHGLDENTFYPIGENHIEYNDLNIFKKSLLGNKEYNFILLFNSRNIRRKNIPDTILAWKLFTDSLPKEQAEKCLLILHTSPVDDNGTDLPAVIEYFCTEGINNVMFSPGKLDPKQINYLYNIADGTVLLSTNEGWGLSLTESLLTATPFIANVTGGMQDQMRFEDYSNKWYTPNKNVPSNHMGTYKHCGEWVLPVFPSNISLVGSVPTPYIFDDRCSFKDASIAMEKLYMKSTEQRKAMGEAGREWALGDEAGFTSTKMAQRIILGLDELFKTWKPRESYEFLSADKFQIRKLNHKITY